MRSLLNLPALALVVALAACVTAGGASSQNGDARGGDASLDINIPVNVVQVNSATTTGSGCRFTATNPNPFAVFYALDGMNAGGLPPFGAGPAWIPSGSHMLGIFNGFGQMLWAGPVQCP